MQNVRKIFYIVFTGWLCFWPTPFISVYLFDHSLHQRAEISQSHFQELDFLRKNYILKSTENSKILQSCKLKNIKTAPYIPFISRTYRICSSLVLYLFVIKLILKSVYRSWKLRTVIFQWSEYFAKLNKLVFPVPSVRTFRKF